MRTQRGFTLIELIVVIVILGILAATALPKFLDVKTDAESAGAAGVAGGIASASSINYGGKALSKTVAPTTLNGAKAVVCTSANMGSLLTSGWPAGYTVAASTGGNATCASSESVTCTVTRGTQTADAGVTCY